MQRSEGGRRAYNSVHTAHAPKVVFSKIFQSDILKEIFLPALLTSIHTNGNIALLADSAAKASVLIARGQVRQRISQIIELAAVEQLLGHIVLEPQHLGNLHLDAHLAAYVAEQVVARGIDLVRLLDRTMVQP